MSNNDYGRIGGEASASPSTPIVVYEEKRNQRVTITDTEIRETPGVYSRNISITPENYEVPYDNTDTDITHRTQVYRLTHMGDGTRRKFIDRAYISFSYGGKPIEDFGLIVTYNGSLQKNAYADFSDNVTTSDVWDGQIYWNTHFTNNSLDLTLSTDGMTQRQLDNFRRWFKPGVIRPLVLAEHPNRSIDARISSPPSIDLIPFDEPVTVAVSGGPVTAVKSYTALYKGSISISFVMDEPFWKSRANIVKVKGNEYTTETQDDVLPSNWEDNWISDTSTEISKADGKSEVTQGERYYNVNLYNEDTFKIIHEDNVPTLDMIPSNTLISFGTKDALSRDMTYSIHGSRVGYAITGEEDNPDTKDVDESYGGRTAYWIGSTINNGVTLAPAEIGSYDGVLDQPLDEDTALPAWIAAIRAGKDPKTGESDTENTWDTSIWGSGDENDPPIYNCGYLYYAGTAPCRPIITFKITPLFENDYIVVPYNPIHSSPKYLHKTANTFIVEGEEKYRFKFTTPSVYTGYNQAIRVFKQYQNLSVQGAWEEVRAALRDNVKHWAPRAYALSVIDSELKEATTTRTDIEKLGNCIKKMKLFLDNHNGSEDDNWKKGNWRGTDGQIHEAVADSTLIQINCQTGEVLGTFSYRVMDSYSEIGSKKVFVENIGDMMRSNYLTLEERNYPNEEDGLIQTWTEENKQHSYRFYTDCPMSNVSFQYNYMYY